MRLTASKCGRREFLAVAGCALLTSAAGERRLFDGASLDGWVRAGNGLWTVQDNAIVGRSNHQQPGPGYLFTDSEFDDFDLQLEFWISKSGNSGVYVRQPLRQFGIEGDQRPAHSPGDGVEIQISYKAGNNVTGAVYDRQKATRLVGAEERWNAFRIECRGPRLRVWVDGTLVNDFSPLASRKGAIGFQVHGGKPHDHVVRFRNIRLA